MSDEQIEIPVLVKTPSTPDGSVAGIWKFRSLWQRAFSSIAKHPYVLAFIALGYAAKKAVEGYWRQDAAINSLNQSLIHQGVYTRGLSEQYQAMARDIEKTTAFADEDVMAAQAAMQPYLKGMTISSSLMKGVANFAVAQGMTLEKAAALIGRTIGTSTNALARQGVEIDSALTGQERLVAVVDALNRKWGGQAEAQVQGLGAVRQAGNAINNLLEVVGRALAPFALILVQEIAVMARRLLESQRLVELMDLAVYGIETALSTSKRVVEVIVNAIPARFRIFSGAITTFFGKRVEQSFEARAQKIPHVKAISSKQKKEHEKRLKRYFDGRLIVHGNKWNTRKGIINEAAKTRELQFKNAVDVHDVVMSSIGQQGEQFIERQIASRRLQTDKQYQILFERLRNEKNRTEREKLEAKLASIEEETLAQTHKDYASADNKVQMRLDEEKRIGMENTLSHLTGLKDSKFGPQVLIGKAASIAQIAISTKLAIVGAMEACAFIPPPVGEALGIALASFFALYGEEQIKNIVDSDIDNPGRIGEIPLNLESVMAIVGRQISDQYSMVQYIVGTVLGVYGDTVEKISDQIKDFSEKFGLLGQALTLPFTIGMDVTAEAAQFLGDLSMKIGDILASVIGEITEAIKQVVTGIVDAIGETISTLADSFFGWLFAEGGTVTHDTSGVPKITPLHKSGIGLGVKVNVTIRGGLVPSKGGAENLARLIASKI